MKTIFDLMQKWAEVWPLLIPLSILIIYRLNFGKVKPLLVFTIVSFCISGLAVITWLYGTQMPDWLKNNNFLYNINSICRTVLIGWFIIQFRQVKQHKFASVILITYMALVFLNFTIRESFLEYSSQLLASESIVLLILCITYFLGTILDDDEDISIQNPAFLICTGTALYEAANYFITLFLFPLFASNPQLGFVTQNISRYSFIIFCIFMGLGLYQYARMKKGQIQFSKTTTQPV